MVNPEDITKRYSQLSDAKRALLEKRLRGENAPSKDTRASSPRRLGQTQSALSFSQQRLWFLDRLSPGSTAYNLPSAIHLEGDLEAAVLERSLDEIVRRHETLRTTFRETQGAPAQVIDPRGNLSLALVDLTDQPEESRLAGAQSWMQEDARRPFDLSQGPLFRAALLRLQARDHILYFNLHHIISDGWSAGVIYEELSGLYRAFLAGEPSPLAELPVQYADFAVWQREHLNGPALDELLDYWKKKLEGAAAVLDLPADRARPAAQSFHGATLSVVIPPELVSALKSVSQREEATFFMTFLAAFEVLLFRHTQQTDFIVGVPTASRNTPDLEWLIGFFVNTLALRADLSGDLTFRQFLRHVREEALGAFAHQDLPFDRLVEELHLRRDLSYNPLFQVMFAMQNTPGQYLNLPGLTVSPLKIDAQTSMFDLSLSIEEMPEGLTADFEYNSDLFDPSRIQRMSEAFLVLLRGIAAHADQKISDLPILSDAEQHKVLTLWNDTHTFYPLDRCIHQLFEEQVERTPEGMAVIFGNSGCTYAELNARANQLARHLGSLGVAPGVLVGIYLERSIELITAVLAVLKAGGAYLPLDPAYPRERLAYMLQDSATRIVLTQADLKEDLPFAAGEMQVVCVDSDWPSIAHFNPNNLYCLADPLNTAYIIYTSGSTGTPKGVLTPQRGLVNVICGEVDSFKLQPGDRLLQFASISFDTAAEEIFTTLISGATLVLRMEEMIASPSVFWETCRAWAITVLDFPTAYWHDLIAHFPPPPFKLPPSLRMVIIGGEEALPQHLLAWRQATEEQVALLNGYGPTEITIIATLSDLTRAADPAFSMRSVSIGGPLPNVQAYVLDPNLQPLPVGVGGELFIGGAGLAHGYLNRPDLSAEKFIPNPFGTAPGERLYRTGDLVRWNERGELEYLGRIDRQVKLRGFRIELGEIETILALHPGVQDAVVLLRQDSPGDKRLAAYVVSRPGQTLTPAGLRTFLKERVPGYMVPAVYVFLEQLPIGATGKVNHQALPHPEYSLLTDEDFAAPSTPTEEALAKIWAEVLNLEEVGVRHNFFDLGGHSLLATSVISRVQQAFHIEMPLRSLFEAPTVSEFASRIDAILLAAKLSPGAPSSDGDEREEFEL